MVIYNIQTNGACSQLVIEVINDTIYIDPSMVAYVVGAIKFDVINDSKKAFHGMMGGKQYYKPKFQGTGKIFLHATLGSYHKFALKDDEELFVNPNAFIVCRDSVKITPHSNFSLKNFLSGVPMINMMVKGTGSVMVLMPGPVQECALKEDKFIDFGTQVAGYSTQLRVTREVIGDNWPNSPKMARVFRGTGSVFFCPIPNKGSRSRSSK